VEEALSRIDGGAVTVVSAGRTDAGVHANGQVARAVVRSRLDESTMQRALNATLPPDVRVLRVDPASDTFRPRVDARSKTYQHRFSRSLNWRKTTRLSHAGSATDAGRRIGAHQETYT
jgi:tRNA pseudouridine38-40 synthase